MNIEGKKILVTGGAKRVGREICKAFAEAGARVIIHYNSSKKEAKALLQKLGGASKGHEIIKADLSIREELSGVCKILKDIDVLVNNASVFDNKCLIKEDIDNAKKQFDINFWVPFELMCKLAKKRQKESVIINMLDYRINKCGLNDGSYLISKKSLEALTLMSALQWAPKIRVNGIASGFVIPPVGMEESTMEKSLKKVPTGKVVSVKDICSTCLYLVKTESVTGQIVYLDGGAHL